MNKSQSKYFNTAAKMNLALISLLKKKTLEYITVSELCKEANVNRSTFYLHYETVGDLLDETTQYLLDGFRSYFSDYTSTWRFDASNCATDELLFISDKYLIPYLSYVKDNKEVFATALKYNKTLGFDNVYKRMFEHIFNPILDRFSYPEKDRKYVMMYYLNGMSAIVVEWLKDECVMPMEEVSEIMKVCVYGRK